MAKKKYTVDLSENEREELELFSHFVQVAEFP